MSFPLINLILNHQFQLVLSAPIAAYKFRYPFNECIHSDQRVLSKLDIRVTATAKLYQSSDAIESRLFDFYPLFRKQLTAVIGQSWPEQNMVLIAIIPLKINDRFFRLHSHTNTTTN